MTFPDGEIVASSLERWSGKIIVGCAVGTIACLGWITWLQSRVTTQAHEGQKARITQCAREPIIRKLVVAGAKYKLLTPADVQNYKRTAPIGCP